MIKEIIEDISKKLAPYKDGELDLKGFSISSEEALRSVDHNEFLRSNSIKDMKELSSKAIDKGIRRSAIGSWEEILLSQAKNFEILLTISQAKERDIRSFGSFGARKILNENFSDIQFSFEASGGSKGYREGNLEELRSELHRAGKTIRTDPDRPYIHLQLYPAGQHKLELVIRNRTKVIKDRLYFYPGIEVPEYTPRYEESLALRVFEVTNDKELVSSRLGEQNFESIVLQLMYFNPFVARYFKPKVAHEIREALIYNFYGNGGVFDHCDNSRKHTEWLVSVLKKHES